jgi:hypothetical protein
LPEFAAIFTAILTVPTYSKVKIFTNSAVVISQFTKFKNLVYLFPIF